MLAGWLSGASPAELDDVALVSSITGWRKVTSWAQAQELAAVAELSRRRGVTSELAPDRTPVEELAADFAPNEVALALTLTQCAADCLDEPRRQPGRPSPGDPGGVAFREH